MSRELHDNQPIGADNSDDPFRTGEDPRRTSVSSVKSGEEGQQSSAAARVSHSNVPSTNVRSHPTSTNGSTRGNSPPRLTRRKSSFVVSENESPENSDEDTDDSKKRIKKKALKGRSHRTRKQSVTPSESVVDNEGESHRPSHREADDADQDDIEFSGSDHEYTLKDRQDAINITHPFGLPLWKPALYKKSRSVIRNANSALHSMPSPELYLYPGNIIWAVVFGWWLALISYILSILLLLTPFGGWQYSRVLRELSYYIFWPFGKYVERMNEDWEEDEERDELNIGDGEFHIDEDHPLLGRRTSIGDIRRMKRENHGLFGKLGEIGPAGLVFYFWWFLVMAPTFLLVSALCWLFIFSIPMAKLTYAITKYLKRHPLSLHFKHGSSRPLIATHRSRILLCTYRAVGFQYYKYTYDGINIMFINLMPLVFFLTFSYVLEKLGIDYLILPPSVYFTLSVISAIPISYFIGMAVASISAQSSIGLGAVINATFGSIVEIILYAMALSQGRGKLTEGSIIGSLMAGVLLMPGLSMISGGMKRKVQRFNAKSAGVTSTMLIMATIGAFTPTLFYQTYAPTRMKCHPCPKSHDDSCQVCVNYPSDPVTTPFYDRYVVPLMYFSAIILLLSYLIGLWFTLRTHASLVWQTPHPPTENETTRNLGHFIPKRLVPANILHQLLPQNVLSTTPTSPTAQHSPDPVITIPATTQSSLLIPDSNSNDNQTTLPQEPNLHIAVGTLSARSHHEDEDEEEEEGEEEEASGHDSPNWSKTKSLIVLLSFTALYSIIAEILVDNVNVFLGRSGMTEKFTGLTLIALVPTVTEFVNAISFALNGNIALSMEIGSAYALQVCLLQIPAMVAFSGWYNRGKNGAEQKDHTFTLVFPRWDMFAVIFSVCLLTYTYIEGKSNYFKGSILVLCYLVLMAGFYWAPDTVESY